MKVNFQKSIEKYLAILPDKLYTGTIKVDFAKRRNLLFFMHFFEKEEDTKTQYRLNLKLKHQHHKELEAYLITRKGDIHDRKNTKTR